MGRGRGRVRPGRGRRGRSSSSTAGSSHCWRSSLAKQVSGNRRTRVDLPSLRRLDLFWTPSCLLLFLPMRGVPTFSKRQASSAVGTERSYNSMYVLARGDGPSGGNGQSHCRCSGGSSLLTGQGFEPKSYFIVRIKCGAGINRRPGYN